MTDATTKHSNLNVKSGTKQWSIGVNTNTKQTFINGIEIDPALVDVKVVFVEARKVAVSEAIKKAAEDKNKYLEQQYKHALNSLEATNEPIVLELSTGHMQFCFYSSDIDPSYFNEVCSNTTKALLQHRNSGG